MTYGDCDVLIKEDNWIRVKCDKNFVDIYPHAHIKCLLDPFPYEENNINAYMLEMNFDEFMSNIDDDNEFIDDLIYIIGIGVEG